MTRSRRASLGRALSRAAAVLALVAGLGAVHLGTPPSALAHDGLVGTSPAAGSTVPEGPATVELDFTAEPLPIGTLVAVTGPDGAPVSAGDAEIRGTTVVQPLDRTLSAGTYRVEWRSSSSDGHALSGTFDFAVTTGSAPSGTPSPAASSGPDTTAAEDGVAAVWPAVGGVVLVGLGVVLVSRLRRRG
ncbi:copper resistance CopC family protein [Blastococcus goldschmidtiae]|uniref:Copper resistance protein CopC n=1 Tax=Blastococcus goldschmidtiae TaxID=3075546 RepID=A0ABU2KDK4_9ACTN|nr:copper resistance protein CopC [Blastococcus sp. DSM 46792]MDT0278269.1 copper resistance protein CopC [Blastococcus sp. DSM 46792]